MHEIDIYFFISFLGGTTFQGDSQQRYGTAKSIKMDEVCVRRVDHLFYFTFSKLFLKKKQKKANKKVFVIRLMGTDEDVPNIRPEDVFSMFGESSSDEEMSEKDRGFSFWSSSDEDEEEGEGEGGKKEEKEEKGEKDEDKDEDKDEEMGGKEDEKAGKGEMEDD